METAASFFEQTGGTYTRVDNVLLPNLTLEETESKPIGKYGRMRKRYLKEHWSAIYSAMLLNGKLCWHLSEIDEACEERIELLTRQMAEREGVTEALKTTNQICGVKAIQALSVRQECGQPKAT